MKWVPTPTGAGACAYSFLPDSNAPRMWASLRPVVCVFGRSLQYSSAGSQGSQRQKALRAGSYDSRDGKTVMWYVWGWGWKREGRMEK